MAQYKVVWSSGVTIRTAPSTMSGAVSVLSVGSTIDVLSTVPDADSPSDTTKIWGKVANGYVAIQYGTVRMVLVDTTTPSGPTITHTIRVQSDGKISIDGGAFA